MQTRKFTLHPLLHSAHLVEDRLRQRLAQVGLLPKQARVVDGLARMGKTSQVSLAREFGVSPASMSTMTARLIAAGYISREIDPDEARSNLLDLTDKGRTLLDQIHEAWADIDTLILDLLGTESTQDLQKVTRALRDALGGRAPTHGPNSSFKPKGD
jgi:DNA-binding MarR family transcriptional regulator